MLLDFCLVYIALIWESSTPAGYMFDQCENIRHSVAGFGLGAEI